MTDDHNRYLAWFLGPKAENGPLFEELLLLVLRDYIHWRRNYYPGDRILVTRSQQRRFEGEQDALSQRVSEITAELRRNFPFYSPRYIAHELSDTTLPAMIGYFAGMLYNPNNVTPEAAPVTVDWEIEACSRVLTMLGYIPPPPPMREDESSEDYARRMRREFGWAHITHGGTTANVEALWVARSVRYLPLAIRDVALRQGLRVDVKRTDGTPADITDLSELEALQLRPNDAIYLLARYVDAIRERDCTSIEDAGVKAWSCLNESEYAPANGTGAAFHRFPPVIFVSGAAHYSVSKAADILGIGKNNVIKVRMDRTFRMDVDDLARQMRAARDAGRVPLAVVAIAGTTEEGAVDPIHEILDLRSRQEREEGSSFWLHIDAAWGGYIRSLFCLDHDEEVTAVLAKVSAALGMPFEGDIPAWHLRLAGLLDEQFNKASVDAEASQKLGGYEHRLDDLLRTRADVHAYATVLKDLLNFAAAHGAVTLPSEECFRLTLQDRLQVVSTYVQSTTDLSWHEYHKEITIAWGSRDVAAAFLAMAKSDSITVDPHKMGYVPYPCGVVAFKNDRVRHFILQSAPYITSARQSVLLHMPPKRTISWEDGSERKVAIDAFAPFILEGSRPGAAAASLWLATQTIPLTMKGHGSIVRASLLAARELYEWLVHWNKIVAHTGDSGYEFVPVPGMAPDTNIVAFGIKKTGFPSLSAMNELTSLVYKRFSIQAELGEREYIYLQPFFLSKTTMTEPDYPCAAIEAVLDRHGIGDWKREYAEHGMIVLRATVMSPYVQAMKETGAQNLIKEFMGELDRAASEGVCRPQT
ncbi:MAG: hypothetical protein DLM70_16040 [Chloroflexi bacterium]|nr:MAG: hypothetical protein DLM70_16040 [Chloroflexota bacterium]